MTRIIKSCLQCNKPFKTGWNPDRSKFCSRPCTSAYKIAERKVRKKDLQKLRTIERTKLKGIKERQKRIPNLISKNKRKKYKSIGDGTNKFGNDILTLKNYKEPLKPIPITEGFGYYGTLAADVKTGKIQCHLCGELYNHLGAHIISAHKVKVKDYREKFGLAYTTALVSEKFRLYLKEKTLVWMKNMTPDEKQAHFDRMREIYQSRKHIIMKNRVQPKKTLEGMNKDGSCPDQTLKAIVDLKVELGHVPSKSEFIEYKGSRYVHLAYKHFGSWTKAIASCKFDDKDFLERINVGNKHKKYTDEDLLDSLKVYVEEHRQAPTTTDWKRDLLPDYEQYINHFGTIENARLLAGVYDMLGEIPKTIRTRSKYYRKTYENRI